MQNYNKALDNGAGGPDEISDQQAKQLLSKFQRKGFDGLTLEEVASALIIPNFAKTFQQHTGIDWSQKFEVKAFERLNRAKFDLQWMARKDSSEHAALFINCQRGDLVKVRQYIKDSKDPNIKGAVDATKKSPLHIASMEGHLSIVELLLMSGFNPNSRDRTLKTPLQFACLHGHESVADTLLKGGADIVARDSLGRTCIHFAASGPSAQVLQLILATKPELANDADHRKRSPLHYCVWNSSQHQVELLRTLLDFRGNPLALDEDLKTPIHHAAEGGRTRALPIMLQRGGQEAMMLRDRSQKTPLELAANERTREVMVVYSSSPLNHNKEDIKYLDSAIQGNKLDSKKKKVDEPKQPVQATATMEKRQFPVVEQEVVAAEPPPPQVKWTPASMNQWIREKFFTIMKKVQEAGIKANHHLKKPYVYTGSWMEGINSMEELYGAIKDIPAGEMCVRAFNILCPFDRQLPQAKGLEDVVDGFYGEMWFDGSTQVVKTEQLEEMRRKMQQEYLARITDLETQLQLKNQHLFDTDQELAQARASLEVQQRREKSSTEKLQAQIDQLNKQLKQKDEALSKHASDIKKLEKTLETLRSENEELRNQPQGISEEEAQQYQEEIMQLKERLQKQMDEEKAARVKAGQLFIKTITNLKQAQDEKLAVVKKEAVAQYTAQLAAEKQKLVAERDKLSSNFNAEKNKLLSQIAQQQAEKKEEAKLIVAQALPENAVGGMDNLQDDDAIIVLLKALKGKKPPMKEKMKLFDGDLDGKLTQEEFRNFLSSIKLSQQDIHSLCRIAGFIGGRKLLGIDEFAQILQDRPKQREQFEQALFNKLLDAIQARKLTLPKVFELIDTDGSGNLSPAELKQGLKSLKIILNQKDLNNMFCIFDSDKSGSISLQEMKETLDRYEALRKQNQGEEEVVDEDERIKSVDEENPFSEIDPQDLPYEQEFKEWVVDTADFTPLFGKLKVQIVKGTPQNVKSIYCIVILKGSAIVDKQFVLFSQTEFKQALYLPVENVLRENLAEQVQIQFYANEYSEQNFLGDVRIMWKKTLETPNKYVVNHLFQLTNTTYIKEKSKMFQPTGAVNVQIKFIPTKPDEIQQSPVALPKFTGTIVEEGVLDLTLVQCILAPEMKTLKEPKFYCQVKFMSIDEKILAKLTANNDLYFESKFQQPLQCVTHQQIPSIFVKVYVETPKNFLLSQTQVLGEFYIDWSECILHAGEYLSKKSFLLSSGQSKLYMKVRYVPRSMFQQIVGFKEGVSEKEKKKQLTLDDMQTGTLKVLFVRAVDLRADDGDTSDPYCIAKVLSFDKEMKVQSKTRKSTLNPDWRDLQIIKGVLLPKEPPYPPLELEVFDEDRLGDDSLGVCKIDLAPAVSAPCTWGVNDMFDVKDPQAKGSPKVYIQVYWVPQGMKDPNLKAKDKFDSSGSSDLDPNFIDGTLIVKVVHARELQGKSPDPYVAITFPGNKEFKTESISSSTNPIFNQALSNTFKIPKETGKVPLKVLVKDSNVLSDTVMGFVDVDWSESVVKPGDWSINQVYNLSALPGSKQFGSIGYLYLQAKFLERGMIDDQSEAPLVENLFEVINSKQGIYQGILRVFLVHARGLVADDDTTSDPYVVFKLPGGKKVETQPRPKTVNPSWKTIYNLNVSMPKDTIQPLRIEIFDDDLISDDLIGYTTVDLAQCFGAPQQWKFNEVIDLFGDLNMQNKYKRQLFGKIYLQIMFCLQGIQNSDPPLPLTEDLDEILREQQQENKKPMKGQLYINIPVALGLKADDGFASDPYCELTFPDKLKIKTKMIEKTLNPIFNFQYKWNCNIIQEQYAPIQVKIFDSDALSDDLLAEFEVPWMVCYKNPTVWEINKTYPLSEGKCYVQAKFLNPGQESTPEGIRACDTIQELKNDYGRVLGKINVKIISASQLYNADITGKSDPFVECYLSSETKKMKTPVIDNTLDPKWDFEGAILIDMLRCQVQANVIQFDVFDDDEVGTDFLGSTEIDLIEILEKNPGSVVPYDLPLKDPKKKGNPNLGSLKLTLSWFPDPYNEGVIGLRVPPKMFTGDLVLRFPNARQLPKGDPYVNFYLTHDPEKSYRCKEKASDQNPNWDFEQIVAINLSERDILTERVKATVKNYNQAWKDTFMGKITIELTDVFHKQGEWLNKYCQLQTEEGKEMDSYLYLQAQFRAENTQVDPIPPALIDFQQFINAGKPPRFKGKLTFKYVGLKNLKNMDITGLSDPFVEFKLSKGAKESLKTTTQDDKTDCFWQNPGIYQFADLLKEDFSVFILYIKVYDYDYNSNDVLGMAEINLGQLKSGEWLNQRIPLLDESNFPQKAEIYIQALYEIENDPAQPLPQPPNLYEELVRQQEEEAEKLRKQQQEAAAIPKQPGILRVFCPYAKGLKKCDTFDNSDPYVEFKLSKGSKEMLKTKTIDNNLNPRWDFNGSFKLDMQPQEYKDIFLMATCYDYDTIVSSDFLGFVEIDITQLFQNPGTWVNKPFPLKDEHGTEGKNGSLYLKVQWTPDQLRSSISMHEPPDVNEESQLQQQAEQAQPKQEQKNTETGVLQVNVIKLLGYDKKSQVRIKFENQSICDKNFSTTLVRPDIMYNLRQAIDVKKVLPTVVNFALLEEGGNQVASLNLDVSSQIQVPGSWVNDYFSFSQCNIVPNLLKLYIQVQYRPSGGAVNTQEPDIKPDPQVVAPAQPVATVQPKGKLKVGVVKAEQFQLLDGGKTSNTKVTVYYDGTDKSTACVKGSSPGWQKVLDAFSINCAQVKDVKALSVKLFHDPGFMRSCIMIGEVSEIDIKSVFSQPNQWAIKNDYTLQGQIKESKQSATGYVTLWIGFVPEKEKDNLTSIS